MERPPTDATGSLFGRSVSSSRHPTADMNMKLNKKVPSFLYIQLPYINIVRLRVLLRLPVDKY